MTLNQGNYYEWKGIPFQTVGKLCHCKVAGCGRLVRSYISHAEWHLTGHGEEGH